MRSFVLRLIAAAERAMPGDGALVALFLFTVIVRNLLEGAAGGTVFEPSAFLFHFPVAYVFPMLGIAALMHLLSGIAAPRMLRLMVLAWTLTLLPPVLDLVAGRSSPIGYFPLDAGNAGFFARNFLNPSVDLPGTTAGIRIEAVAGCVLAGLFVYSTAERRAAARGLATAVLFAPLFLVFFTWPMLVKILLERHFPWTATAQEFMQWHAATAPALTGSAHYTVLLVDVWPVALISLWLWPRLDRNSWRETGKRLRLALPAMAGAAAGAAAAWMAASRQAVTFADAASILGSGLAGSASAFLLSVPSSRRLPIVSIALASAAAVGWPTLALSLLACTLAFGAVPGAAGRFLLAFVSTAVGASAVFVPTSGIVPVAPLGLVAGLWALTGGGRLIATAAVAVLAASVAVLAPVPPESAMNAHYESLDAQFSRSSQAQFAHAAASRLAALGGPLVELAQAAHMAGDMARAQWIHDLAAVSGDSSRDLLAVGLNLAAARGDREQFAILLRRLAEEEGGLPGLDGLVLGLAAETGRTDILESYMRAAGPEAGVLAAFAGAELAAGDTASAESFIGAAMNRPDASPQVYAMAVGLASVTGGDYDAIYRAGAERFESPVVLMLSRIRAPLAAGDEPDRPDLVRRCLALSGDSPEVLETCASWFAASGMPDSALALIERSAMAQHRPGRATMRMLCAAAAGAGERERLAVHLAYARSLYPDDEVISEMAGDPPLRGEDER